MRLTYAEIENYRSIKSLRLEFTPTCRILVGINESGKSNILSALSLLGSKQQTTNRDIREPGLHESEIKEARVTFGFTLSQEDSQQLLEKVKSKILSRTYSRPILERKGTPYNLEKASREFEGLYVVDLMNKGLNSAYVPSLAAGRILDGWKKVAKGVPTELLNVQNPDGSIGNLSDFILVDRSEIVGVPDEVLVEATPSDLESILDDIVGPMVGDALPKVLFWNYDESKLLPPRIDLDDFCQNPDMCLPLKRMFELHRISDIKEEITAARNGSANALNNLLRRVAQTATRHFHNTWNEYDGIKFSLSIDGPSLVAGIEDVSNKYELSQRSDGFKRFVTFLLMVSAADESELLKNTLLLIDEPEIGLHPSGARYLMKELIEISKNNYVVFSTHSIFMIDNQIIGRHLITKKKDETTEAVNVTESNIMDEEVIYKALGYSIFSNLKELNVIFEGWRDKKLFQTALSAIPATHQSLEGFDRIGYCFVRGVKQLENVTPLFEAGRRKCLILTDSDAPAKEHQKKYQQGRGYGIWKRFDEVLPGTALVTGEDFVKATAFETAIRDLSKKRGITPITAADLDKKGSRITALKAWLTLQKVSGDLVNNCIEEIKNAVFNDLKTSDIKAEYFDYLAAVLPIVNGL